MGLFFEENIGSWNQYSVIKGDGGMEYAMCTMITGEDLCCLFGVTAHELATLGFNILANKTFDEVHRIHNFFS